MAVSYPAPALQRLCMYLMDYVGTLLISAKFYTAGPPKESWKTSLLCSTTKKQAESAWPERNGEWAQVHVDCELPEIVEERADDPNGVAFKDPETGCNVPFPGRRSPLVNSA